MLIPEDLLLIIYAIVAENFVILAKFLPQRLEDIKNFEVLTKIY